jgi:hypothetical protein
MSAIPPESRRLVADRDFGRCTRCGLGATAWHHRRGRSVIDQHQHCPCNGIYLCDECHRYVHAHPFESRRQGWIVSRHTAVPGEVPVKSAVHCDWVLLQCNGQGRFTNDPEETDAGPVEPRPLA